MAARLAAVGCVVVSGGARGIDTAGHEGAVAAGGRTVAVLGCGIDRAYPAGNSRLLERIRTSGSVVSEYPPGVPAYPFHFPLRNRIVAALSLGAVVVEGATGSGSLITSDLALDLGRTVMAVPGPVNSALSRAPLRLIREGAALVRDGDDVIADLGVTPPRPATGGGETDGGVEVPRGLSPAEARVFRSLAGPTLAEDVAKAADLDLRMAVAILLGMELRGLVQSVGGRYMIRPGRSVSG
jgi:DNA processing protein